MVWVEAKDKQKNPPKIYLHIAQFPPSCHQVLAAYIAPPLPDPDTVDTHLTVKSEEIFKSCSYCSPPADELRTERIWTKARTSPQVGRAELRHYIDTQNPSRLMYLRVCRKPHFLLIKLFRCPMSCCHISQKEHHLDIYHCRNTGNSQLRQTLPKSHSVMS